MDESRIPAPLPGRVTSWDLSGHTLTMYWTGVDGQLLHAERVGSTFPWTRDDVRTALRERGQDMPPLGKCRPFAALRVTAATVSERTAHAIRAWGMPSHA